MATKSQPANVNKLDTTTAPGRKKIAKLRAVTNISLVIVDLQRKDPTAAKKSLGLRNPFGGKFIGPEVISFLVGIDQIKKTPKSKKKSGSGGALRS